MSKRKQKKDGDEGAAPAVSEGICVARHPRSAGMVRRAKGWGGVLGAILCTALALRANLPVVDAMLRGLAGGIAGYVAVWALAVAVARQFVIAEIRARHAELHRAAGAAAAAASDG
jgi:hypothetical protein